MFSISEVPEQYHRVMASEGRNQHSLGWIITSSNCVSLNCCDYSMDFRWKPDQSIEVVLIGDFTEILENIFSASILKNDHNDLLKWAGIDNNNPSQSDADTLLLKLRDHLNVNIASSILSNLVGDVFAYRSHIVGTN